MNSDLKFRGYAGEVISKFINPHTLLTVTGVILIIVPITLICGWASTVLGSIVGSITGLSLFGIFSIKTSRGDLNCGLIGGKIESGEAIGFAGHFIFFNLLWGIPCLLLAYLFEKTFGITPSVASPSFGLLSEAGGSIRTAFSLVLFCTFICGPSLTGIFVTALLSGNFDGVAEVIAWMKSKWKDIIPYYCALIGGICIFVALYSMPLGYVVYLISQVSGKAAIGAGLFTWLIPGAAALVLGGKMTGAFVAAHCPDPSSSDSSISTSNLNRSHQNNSKLDEFYEQRVAVITKAEKEKKKIPSKAEILSRLDIICEKFPVDQSEAITEIENLIFEWPFFAESQLMAVRMYLRAKREEDGLKAFPKAALLGLKNALFQDVIQLFRELKLDARDKIDWTEELLRTMSDACVIQKKFGDAVWCIEKLASAFNIPEVEIQRAIYQIAENASVKGEPGEGALQFEKFIESYPSSSFIEFAQKALTEERKKSPGAQNSLNAPN